VSEVVYRDAAVDDAAALAAFATRSFVETFGHLYPPEDLAAYIAASYSEDIQAAELADQEIGCALAFKGAAIVGYGMWGPVDIKVEHTLRACELYRLYADKSVQGAGVAHELMRMALARMRARGADALFLSVWENNARAQRFYRGYGFEHIGEHKFMVGRVADRDLIWRLKL
jgi:diamine N-acetyltransferase